MVRSCLYSSSDRFVTVHVSPYVAWQGTEKEFKDKFQKVCKMKINDKFVNYINKSCLSKEFFTGYGPFVGENIEEYLNNLISIGQIKDAKDILIYMVAAYNAGFEEGFKNV